jgi:hypothetical protein
MNTLYHTYRHLSRVILNKIRIKTKFSKNIFSTVVGGKKSFFLLTPYYTGEVKLKS